MCCAGGEATVGRYTLIFDSLHQIPPPSSSLPSMQARRILSAILTGSIALMLTDSPVHAATYQWNGAASSEWNGANWQPTGGGITAGPGQTGGSFNHRLNVNNATANTLIYDALLGDTVYANSAGRGLVIGSGASTGTMVITGGTFSTLGSTAADVMGNSSAAGVSSLTINGGNFIGNAFGFQMNFGSNQQSFLHVLNGTATFSALALSINTGGTGTVNLEGGTLAASLINRTSTGSAIFNFNGGTLQARQDTVTFMQGLTAANVRSGGALIDTSAFNVTIGQALLDGTGGGGLTKSGVGRLTLSGNSTYTGATTISGGTLEIGAGGTTGSLTTASFLNDGILQFNRSDALLVNAPISGSGGVNQVGSGITTLAGAHTYNGQTSVTAGRLNLTGSLTSSIHLSNGAQLSGEGSTTGTIVFTGNNTLVFNPTTPAALSANTVNATAATVTLSLGSSSPAATGIVVLDAPGGIMGTAGGLGSNFVFTGRGTSYLNVGSTQLLFDYTPATIKWTGGHLGNPTFWDVNTTANWSNSGSPDTFFAGDSVTFDDTAAQFNVVIQGTSVEPGAVTFQNSMNAYMVSGGALGGSGAALVKNGSNSLTLLSTNTYGGGTTINEGTVNTGVAGGLGTGLVTVGAPGTLNLTGGALAYTGIAAGLAGAGNVHVTLGTGSDITPFNGANSGFSGTLHVGGGALAGAGKVTLNGAFAAGSNVNVLEHATVAVSGAVTQPGAIVLNGGDTGESLGQLRLDSGATWSGPVTLAGTMTGAGDGTIGSSAGVSTISGPIGETGGSRDLLKVGAGVIVLANANTYTGTTLIQAGAIVASANDALGINAVGTTVTNGATLGLGGGVNYTTAETVMITGPGSLNANTFFTGSAVQRGSLQGITGSNTWAGNILFNGNNTRIGVQDGAQLNITGSIIENAANSTIIFRHGNTPGSDIIVSGSGNSWTGFTDIYGGGGAVKLGVNQAFPAGTILRVGTTGIPGVNRFDLNGFNQTIAGLTQVAAGASVITNTGASPSTLTIQGTSGQSYDGSIQDGTSTVSLVKGGSSTQTLNGASPYTGSTTVNGGTLAVSVSGSLSGTTSIQVGNGTAAATLRADGIVGSPLSVTTLKNAAFLGGSGTLGGSVFAESGATISPGTGPGLLTIDNGFNLATGAHLNLQLTGRVAATEYDQVAVTAGDVFLAGDLAGSTLTFAPTDFVDIFFLILNNGSGLTTGTLGGVEEGGTLTIGGRDFAITYVADSLTTNASNFGTSLGNDVAILAIPEPSALTSLLGGMGLLMGLQRRRRDLGPQQQADIPISGDGGHT